jgi:hypothetical protein
VLPVPEKLSRPHSIKTTAIFEAFTATYPKICRCMIFQSTTTTTTKNIKFGEGFIIFLFLLPIFGLKKHKFSKFNLNLYHSTLLLLTAIFTATNFSSQIIFLFGCFELFSCDHGHLATLPLGKNMCYRRRGVWRGVGVTAVSK